MSKLNSSSEYINCIIVTFLFQAQSSVLDAHDVPVVKTATIEDENQSFEGNAGMPGDQNAGKYAFNVWHVRYKVSVWYLDMQNQLMLHLYLFY